jgi:Skp family chaperone for outer membrane proteins
MRRLLIILSCLVLVQIPFIAASHAETTIAALNVRKLVEQSAAGKSIQAALKVKRDALQKEADGLEKKMREQQQELIKGRKDMKAEEFEAKKKAFESEFIKSNETIRKKVTDLDKQRKQALHTLQENIAKVAADIADERKIQIVVDRELVVIVDQSLDLTEEALKRLDAKIKTIPLK